MCDMYAKDSLDRFGDDLMTQLLAYVSLEDRFRFESVSKQWQRVVFTTQTEIIGSELKFVEDFKWWEKTTRLLATIVTKCPNISRICFPNHCRPDDTVIDLMIKHCPRLAAIEMHFEWINDTSIDMFFTRFGPQLKSLNTFGFKETMDKKSMEKLMEMCVTLESLHIHPEYMRRVNTPNLTFPSVPEVRLKALKSIDAEIDMTLAPNVNALDAFADKYKDRMKTIVLSIHRWPFLEQSLEAFNKLMGCLSRMRFLIGLRFSLPMLSSQVLIPLLTQLGGNCERLKSLDIDMTNWRPELLHVISEHFKSLKRLHVRVTMGAIWGEVPEMPVTSDALVAFKRITHFQLSITKDYDNNEPFITDLFFANIGHNLPNLQYLNVKYVKISDESLISLSGLKKIRGITLYGDTKDAMKMTEMGLKNAMTKCPNAFIKFRYFE